jgi:hypothetical protein
MLVATVFDQTPGLIKAVPGSALDRGMLLVEARDGSSRADSQSRGSPEGRLSSIQPGPDLN